MRDGGGNVPSGREGGVEVPEVAQAVRKIAATGKRIISHFVERRLSLSQGLVAVVVDDAELVGLGPQGREQLGVTDEVEEGPRESLSGSISTGDDQIDDWGSKMGGQFATS